MVTQVAPYPMGKIIFSFFVFWPTGIYLLYDKVSGVAKEKCGIFRCDKLRRVAIIKIVMGTLIPLALFLQGQNDTALALFAFWVSGGLILQLYVSHLSKKAEKYRKIIEWVVNKNVTDFAIIASNTNLEEAIVQKLYTKMLEDGFFESVSTESEAPQDADNKIEDIHKQRCGVCGAYIIFQNECSVCGSKY